ncbi:MAG: FkbM family methyltransferase, partial [bacterium]|nr:FkbM family methyltransferase [bacterium]
MLQQLTAELQRTQMALIQACSTLVRCRQRIAALEAGAICRDAGVKPAFAIDFRAQFAEDQVAWEALGRPTKGFYVEAGAFDGVNFSVTYALEAMGWTGLLVEPHPLRSEQCRKNRPGSRVVGSALGGPGDPKVLDFVMVEDRFGGMMSYVKGSSPHAQAIEQQNAVRTTVKVPATTLDELLAGHTGPIDLVSLDV